MAALALFLPAVFLLAFAMWQRQKLYRMPHLSGAAAEPERTALSGPVSGWSGRLDRGDRPPVTLRLETLHPFPSRQAFDAAALAARFPSRRSDCAR